MRSAGLSLIAGRTASDKGDERAEDTTGQQIHRTTPPPVPDALNVAAQADE